MCVFNPAKQATNSNRCYVDITKFVCCKIDAVPVNAVAYSRVKLCWNGAEQHSALFAGRYSSGNSRQSKGGTQQAKTSLLLYIREYSCARHLKLIKATISHQRPDFQQQMYKHRLTVRLCLDLRWECLNSYRLLVAIRRGKGRERGDGRREGRGEEKRREREKEGGEREGQEENGKWQSSTTYFAIYHCL